jgi:hypothetical protein
VFCQLEVLRHCLPPSVRRFLEELPESLDETYERVLREIKKPDRDHARRLLQCLVVAIRPLRVEELVEVLAIDFDDAGGIPKLNPSWRWEDQEQALFTSCSSLIAIIDSDGSRIVQFSHFSVKEFLTSPRLDTSTQDVDVSCYHVALKPAHTILGQACVGVLLQLDYRESDGPGDVRKNAPLAGYAAEYWVRHAQFEDVVSRIKGTEYLFDLNKPYFAALLRLYDIDIGPSLDSILYHMEKIPGYGAKAPLYYAALCGFLNLVEQLIVRHPRHVDAVCGWYRTPPVAALAGRHFQVAQLLHRNGASLDVRGGMENTPLHCAVNYGDLEMIQGLLECEADVDALNEFGSTPLLFALAGDRLNDPRIVQTLLEHGADPNARGNCGLNPLHRVSELGKTEIARVLIEHGVDVDAKDDWGRTLYDIALGRQRYEIIILILDHRAK